jgi:predicted nucleic-acid-binding Zn-ribbon protein
MGENVKSCKNCGGTELFSKTVQSAGMFGPDLLPTGGAVFRERFRIRICGSCGFVEWFVLPEHLENVTSKFPKEGDTVQD